MVGAAGEIWGVGGGEAGWAGAESAAETQLLALGFILGVPLTVVEGGRWAGCGGGAGWTCVGCGVGADW